MSSRRSTLVASFLALLAIAAALSPSAFAAKKNPSGNLKADEDFGPTIALSPFEVRAESIEFKDWIKIESPHFILYTDASTKAATRLVKEMEMVHQAAQFYFRRKAVKVPPVFIVLPTGRSDWRKIANKGGVEWKVASSMVGNTRRIISIQYDWQQDGLESMWSMLGVREVESMNIEGPLWFNRGVAKFFQTVEFRNDTLTIGKQSIYAYLVRERGWMDWAKFFKISYRSPEYVKDSDALHHYLGQCSVFAHFLLTNSDPVWTQRLIRWAAYLDAGNEPTEEAFKDTFQLDWKGFEKLVDQMLNGGEYTTGIIKFPPAALNFPITKVDLPAREMRELFVLTQILNQDTVDSDKSLDALLARGLKTEGFRELLADACQQRDRLDSNLERLRSLIADGSSNPAVYTQAADVLFDRSVPKTTLDARLGDEAAQIRDWCNRALELEPLYMEANELLAWTEALAPSVEKANLETIARICRTIDGKAATDEALTALAMARWRSGGLKQSRTICERLIASPFSGLRARRIAKELLAKLDDATGPTPPAVSAAVEK
jgi:hypothetical protein